jgi:hypothetical protein
LNKYEISQKIYHELYYFCLQYKDYIVEPGNCYTADAPAYSQIGGNKTNKTDTTSKKAVSILLCYFLKKIATYEGQECVIVSPNKKIMKENTKWIINQIRKEIKT